LINGIFCAFNGFSDNGDIFIRTIFSCEFGSHRLNDLLCFNNLARCNACEIKLNG